MLYVIVGPTGSGKTEAAIWLAHYLHAPIVNADAFQVYKGMNIGTNKNIEAFQDIPHYLFDLVEPKVGFTVAKYKQAFDALMLSLKPEVNPIVVVGGTGLYLKATLYDFPFEPKIHPVDMAPFETMEEGLLYQNLVQMDPKAAQSIHPHNRRRVLRALEIIMSTGKLKSDIEITTSREPKYPVQFLGLNPPREEVYQHINARVFKMVEAGLFDEVKQVLDKTPADAYALDAIGYKQVIPFLRGERKKEETIAAIQQATRRYAKRQWTYFHNQLPVKWFPSIDAIREAFLHG